MALVVFVVFDVSTGQIAKALVPPADHVALQQQERIYRIRSDLYHHDLAASVDAVGGWGPRRHPIHTNSLGFKARAVEQVALRSESKRVLLLGDSFVEGIGVAYPETFAGIMDAALRERGVEVLNAAVASYSPVIYYRKLKYLAIERGLAVDQVVVFIDISDMEDEALYYELRDDRVVDRPDSPVFVSPTLDRIGTIPPRPWKDTIVLNSLSLRVLRAIKSRLAGAETQGATGDRMGFMGGAPRGTWTYDDRAFEEFGRRGQELAAAHMEMLLAVLAKLQVPLTIVVYPWPDQILERDRGERHAGFWRTWCSSRGVRFVDLFPLFVNGTEPLDVLRAYYIPGDIHFNEAGHRLIAEALLSRLWG